MKGIERKTGKHHYSFDNTILHLHSKSKSSLKKAIKDKEKYYMNCRMTST